MSRNVLKEVAHTGDMAFIENTLKAMTPGKFKEFCLMGIEQQDRDTRLACKGRMSTSWGSSMYIKACNAVMNCKGGLS